MKFDWDGFLSLIVDRCRGVSEGQVVSVNIETILRHGLRDKEIDKQFGQLQKLGILVYGGRSIPEVTAHHLRFCMFTLKNIDKLDDLRRQAQHD